MNVNCPKGEILWQTIYDSKHSPLFIITSKPARDYYYLYRVSDSGALQKLGKDRTPPALMHRYGVDKESGNGK